jgi:sigma-E factor negative regulatory protein RseC
MMRNAIVVDVYDDGWAEVAVRRTSACGHDCTSCGGCTAGNGTLTVRAVNKAGAAIGDRVVIESSTEAVLSAAVLAYLLPMAALLAAVVLTTVLGCLRPPWCFQGSEPFLSAAPLPP